MEIPRREVRLAKSWSSLSDEDRDRFGEVAAKRSRVLESAEHWRHWAKRAEDVNSFLTGSLEWADQPLELVGDIRTSDKEDMIALHSILIPAGIVNWSPLEAMSMKKSLRTLFGGARADIRGLQAPRPASHRLFVPEEEVTALIHNFFQAVLLHGVNLVAQHGRTQDWRRWFCELTGQVLRRGLNKVEFTKLSGELIETTLGLAVKVKREIFYLSRSEILKMITGPIYLVSEGLQAPGLLWEDPVNQLLCDEGVLRWEDRDKKIEVSLCSLPIVRAKK